MIPSTTSGSGHNIRKAKKPAQSPCCSNCIDVPANPIAHPNKAINPPIKISPQLRHEPERGLFDFGEGANGSVPALGRSSLFIMLVLLATLPVS